MRIIFSNEHNEIEFCFAEDFEQALEVLNSSKNLIEDALTAGIQITIYKG